MNTGDTRLEVADPSAYVEMICAHVGNNDPLTILTATPDHLLSLVEMHGDERFLAAVERGWNPSQVVGHLIDTEFVFGYRLRLIWSESSPEIQGMDQDLWVDTQGYQNRTPLELIPLFAGVRHANLHAWRGVSPEQLQRSGRHQQRGPESLETLVKLHAGHDLHHLAQLEKLLA